MRLKQELLRAICSLGWDLPSEREEEIIDVILSGRDCIARSQPVFDEREIATIILALLQKMRGKGKPETLIIAPNFAHVEAIQHLALQLARYLNHVGCRSLPTKLSSVKAIPRILVGTPQSVLGSLTCGALKPHTLQAVLVVIPKASLLNLPDAKSSLDEVLKLVSAVKGLQTILCSADTTSTMADSVAGGMHDPLLVEFEVENGNSEYDGLTHFFLPVRSGWDKYSTLYDLYDTGMLDKAVIFCSTKQLADDIAEILSYAGYHAIALHGGIPKEDQADIVKAFTSERCNVLVSTAMAAESLLRAEVTVIINFDIESRTAYLRRADSGKRRDRQRVILTLVNVEDDGDCEKLCEIEEHLGVLIEEVPLNIPEYVPWTPTLEDLVGQD